MNIKVKKPNDFQFLHNRYKDLKAEAEAVVGRKDDPDVLDMLNKLTRFYLEDSRSIPNAKVMNPLFGVEPMTFQSFGFFTK